MRPEDAVFDVDGQLSYWFAWRRKTIGDVVDGREERLEVVRVDPRRWAAPLVNGTPIRYRGMVTYWPVEVCQTVQYQADDFYASSERRRMK
jgi:hypothetical protein